MNNQLQKLEIEYDDESKVSANTLVQAKINGEAQQFILDTGCRTTSLYASEFSNQLPKVGSNESSGAVGTEVFDLVQIKEFEFGPIKKTGLAISRANSPLIHKNLLGMDILKGSRFLMSHKNQSLEFSPDLKFQKLEEIFPDPRGHQPFINIKLNDLPQKVLWDSGAGITLVDLAFVNSHPEFFKITGESTGTDSTGNQVVTPQYQVQSLEIAGQVFDPHEIAAIDMSHFKDKSGNPVNIVLGFSTLRQADWCMDFENNKWAISHFHGN